MSSAVRGQYLNITDCGRGHRVYDAESPTLVRQVVSPINDIRRVLNSPLRRVVFYVGQRPIGKANLRGWLVSKLKSFDFGARGDEPAFHTIAVWDSG